MSEIQLPQRVADNIDRFIGRSWLLPAVLEWWNRGDTRVFLLTGLPGTGKSMIAAWLAGFGPLPLDADAAARLHRVRGAVRAAHFCQAASRNFTPQAFAEAMATQLTRTVPRYGEALAAILQDRVQIVGSAHAGTAAAGSSVTGVWIERIDLGALSDDYSFDQVFTRPLKKTYESGYSEPMLLIVDALDESLNYSGKTTAELLSGLDDLPRQVRILATTRGDPRVLKCFDGMPAVDVIADAPSGDEDARTYAAERLRAAMTLDEGERAVFAERLARQAKGVFLYAAMVLDELLARLPDVPTLETQPLPEGLSGLYRQFLRRELGKGQDESRWFDTYEPLLGLLAVAQGDGLTARQLAAIMGGRDVRAPLRACKQYLTGELPNGPFKPFHKSFADFLLEEEDNPDFHIDAAAMHRRIVDHYRGSADASVDPGRVDVYALAHYASHLVSAGRREELIALVTGSPRWMQAKFEALLSDEPFVADIELAIANTTDVVDLVKLHAALNAVRLKAAHYSDDDLKALALLGRAQEARSYARLRLEPAEKISALLALADATGRAELRSALLDEALGIAHAGQLEEWQRSTTLDSLAVALVHAGRIDDATQLVGWSPSLVEARAAFLVGQVQFHEALNIVRGETDRESTSRARLLALIASELALRRDERAGPCFEEALTAARDVTREHTRAMAFGEVAAALARTKDTRAPHVFDEAVQLASAIPEGKRSLFAFAGQGAADLRTTTLQDLAVLGARSGLGASAVEAARAISPPGKLSQRFSVLCDVAVELAKADDARSSAIFAELTELAPQYWESTFQEFLPGALGHISASAANPFELLLANGLVRAGRMTEDEAVARSVSPHVRLEALRGRMVTLARAGDPRAAAALAEVVKTAQSVDDDKSVASVAASLASGLARAGHFVEAQKAIAGMKGADAGNARRNIGIAMAEADRLADATALAKSIDPEVPRVSRQLIMWHVAKGLARNGRFEEAAAAVRRSGVFGDVALADYVVAMARAGHAASAYAAVTGFVENSSNASSASMVLRRLATALADRQDETSRSVRDAAMERLKRCVETIPPQEDRARVEAAAELAVAMAELRVPGSDTVFTQTIDAARSISDLMDREQVLSALVTAWAEAGYVRQAWDLIGVMDGGFRDGALYRLADMLAEQELFAEAADIAYAIAGKDHRLDAVAAVLVREGRVREALEMLGARGPHPFPTALVGWAPWLEKHGRRPATTILRDAMGILAWANPAYGDLAAAVFSPTQPA